MLTKPRKLFALAAISSLSLLSLAGPASADNTEFSFTQTQKNVLEENMDGLGIDDATQLALIEKLETEGTVDSFDPNAEPVDVLSSDEPGFEGTTYVYEDGSRMQSSLEEGMEAPSGISPQSITECTSKSFSGGTNKTNCKVKVSTVTHVGEFRANYTLVNGGNSYISKVYNFGCAGICTIEKTGIVKKTADLNGAAKAEMRVRVAVGPWGTTGYVQLFVKGGKAWSN